MMYFMFIFILIIMLKDEVVLKDYKGELPSHVR